MNRNSIYFFPIIILIAVFQIMTGRMPAVSETVPLNGAEMYEPGQTTHIVVEAPEDTLDMVAILPDNSALNLNYDPEKKIWHNYWTIPAGTKKGNYSAKLIATDIEGRIYNGTTKAFSVKETAPVTVASIPKENIAAKAPAETPVKVEKKPVIAEAVKAAPVPVIEPKPVAAKAPAVPVVAEAVKATPAPEPVFEGVGVEKPIRGETVKALPTVVIKSKPLMASAVRKEINPVVIK